MLNRGCAYAAELRLVIVLAVAFAHVVGVDFRWNVPVPLVNHLLLLHVYYYLQFAVVWVS